MIEMIVNGYSFEETLMEEMMCSSSRDCEGSIVAAGIDMVMERGDYACGWIDLDNMGDTMSMGDFCMPAMMCGEVIEQEAMDMYQTASIYCYDDRNNGAIKNFFSALSMAAIFYASL